ncbi:unnamed protein product [Mytilus coruscus]|uniref:Uncharacterized protein n=1 Tax=Mytilus coruscus TaxID=42192 RepID=A0A6J8C8N7_MYTCO|nr:unnamed protein product [Mytilus coruscus]
MLSLTRSFVAFREADVVLHCKVLQLNQLSEIFDYLIITKFQRRRQENIRRRHFSELRDYLSAKFQRLKGNRVVKIRLQQSPMSSSSNVSNRTYIVSTQDEATSENVAPNNMVFIELKRSASSCIAFNNDVQELELIELEKQRGNRSCTYYCR